MSSAPPVSALQGMKAAWCSANPWRVRDAILFELSASRLATQADWRLCSLLIARNSGHWIPEPIVQNRSSGYDVRS